jgi:hypothetical protein
MIRSLSLRRRVAMASIRGSGLAARRAELDRLLDGERDWPAVDREEADRDEPEADREAVPERDPDPERAVLRPLVEPDDPLLALVLRDRDDPEPLDFEEPLELEVPRLGCGIDSSLPLGM